MSYPALCVVPEQAQSTFFSLIIDGMKSTNSSLYEAQAVDRQLEQCKKRVEFILLQLDSLEHYLPETYQMLMDELDQQQKALKHLEIQDFYQRQSNAEQNKTVDSGNQEQGQEQTDHPTGVLLR
jgi:hypothetical protein